MWHWNEHPKERGLLFHVPNGGARNSREGKKFKLIGVIPGVSDLIYLKNSKCTFIEVKNDFGKQSENQVKWEKKVTEEGFDYYIVRNLESFKLVINRVRNSF